MLTQWRRGLAEEVATVTMGRSQPVDTFFVFTFITSFFGIIVGFIKNLTLGPCRAIWNNTFVKVLLFLSVFCSIMCRCGTLWMILFSFHVEYYRDKLTFWTVFRDSVCPLLGWILIPILALPSPMIVTHPSLIVVPLFTWYTFSGYNIVNYTKKIKCNCVSKKPNLKLWKAGTDSEEKKQNNFKGDQESFIRFSPGWTLINITYTVVNIISFTIIKWTEFLHEDTVAIGLLIGFSILVMLLTCWFAKDDKQGSHLITWLVYKPSDVHTEYVKENC